jgi:hypothetical protein
MTSLTRTVCPQCGVRCWAGPSAEQHADVRAQIVAEGGNGRIHQCQAAATVELPVPDVDLIVASYMRPRMIELGPVREEIDWLASVGRTLPLEVER